MTWDVVLVVFYHYEPERLRRLEKKYLVVITTLTFIPALVFLFIRDSDKGPIYGSVVVSLSHLPMITSEHKTNIASTVLVLHLPQLGPLPHHILLRANMVCYTISKIVWSTHTDCLRVIIMVVFILYIYIGHEIFQLRHELMLTNNDCLVLSSTASPSNESITARPPTSRDDMKHLDGTHHPYPTSPPHLYTSSQN
jgi:hypothetical protein